MRVPLPWSRSCYVCGEANPRGLRLRSFSAGDHVELPFTARSEYSGWNDVIHGGFIATVLDEAMTWAANLGSRRACYAAEITVRMLRPLAAGSACVATARMRHDRRRVFDIESELRDAAGTVYARATGRYMPVPPAELRALRKDLVTAAGCLDVAEIFAPDAGDGRPPSA